MYQKMIGNARLLPLTVNRPLFIYLYLRLNSPKANTHLPIKRISKFREKDYLNRRPTTDHVWPEINIQLRNFWSQNISRNYHKYSQSNSTLRKNCPPKV